MTTQQIARQNNNRHILSLIENLDPIEKTKVFDEIFNKPIKQWNNYQLN